MDFKQPKRTNYLQEILLNSNAKIPLNTSLKYSNNKKMQWQQSLTSPEESRCNAIEIQSIVHWSKIVKNSVTN